MPSRQLAALLLLACGVGVFADRGAGLPKPWSLLAELGTAWLLLPFVAGRAGGGVGVARAGLRGAAVLAVGLASYYGWLWLAEGVAPGTLLHSYRAPAWLAVGVAVGFTMGALGALSHLSRRVAVQASAWSVVAGVPLAEASLAHRFASGPHRELVGVALLLLSALIVAHAARRSAVRPTLLVAGVVICGSLMARAQYVLHRL